MKKVRIKGKISNCNNEIHTLIDSLTREKYYGELVLYFQNGIVEFGKKIERISKEDMRKTKKGVDNVKMS